MKKKVLLILTLIIGSLFLANNVKAMEYTCADSNYYVTDKINGSGYLQCCPNGFYYVSEITQGVTYKTCSSTAIKDKDSCKEAGGSWSKNECTADSKNALGKLSIKNIKGAASDVMTETCKMGKNSCNIKAPQLDDTNDEIFIGYSKTEDCSNIIDNSIRGKTIDIKSEDISTIYACYDKLYVKCEYDNNISIFYGENHIKTYTKDVIELIGMPKNVMDLYYKSKEYCPTPIYHYGEKTMEKFSDTKKGACGTIANTKCKEATLKNKNVIVENNDTTTEKPIEEIKSCEELFSSTTRNLINSIMKWIRILIPLLLIVLGILDFSKAVFSSSEDNMKKVREKFIKRIVAAVLVFLVPIFVNLILDLANTVWSNINSETCIR